LKTQVYFVPGLAAGKEIFQYISLPSDSYETHILEWLIPEKKETLREYSKRMSQLIRHENPVLIGVSFGGMVAQEMSRFLELKKLIIISSIKTRFELPKRLIIAKHTKAYKLMPINTLLKSDYLLKFAIGKKTKRKIFLYQKYLSVKNKTYIEWSISQIMKWDREKPVEGIVHIHGDRDTVFPINNIINPIVVEGGTHVMIMQKAKWLSDELPGIIEKQLY
jgi:pimeloyl-ACP methyl ester carboxylesterase